MANIDPFGFAVLLEDVAPSIECIDGRLFLDRSGSGPEALKTEIVKYANAREAQQWLNLAPIDDLIDSAVSDWSMEDEALQLVADVYRRSWLAIDGSGRSWQAGVGPGAPLPISYRVAIGQNLTIDSRKDPLETGHRHFDVAFTVSPNQSISACHFSIVGNDR
jgi:hypothetical protein